MAEEAEAIELKAVAMEPNDCPLVRCTTAPAELPALACAVRISPGGPRVLLCVRSHTAPPCVRSLPWARVVQGSELTVKMTFKTSKPVANAVWDLKYMVDMASKRKLIGGQPVASRLSRAACVRRCVPRASSDGRRP